MRSKKLLLWLFIAVWFIGAALAIKFLPLKDWLDQFCAWIGTLGWIAPGVYIFAYLLFCIFLIPSIALVIAVAPIFGFWPGLIYTMLANCIGGSAAFLLGRTLLRKRIEGWAQNKPRFQAIDLAVEKNAFMVVTLLRITPVFPFTIFNYLLSMTRVSYANFMLGTICGSMPLNAALIYVTIETAKAVNAINKQELSQLQYFWLIGKIVATVVAIIVVSRIAVKALRETSK